MKLCIGIIAIVWLAAFAEIFVGLFDWGNRAARRRMEDE